MSFPHFPSLPFLLSIFIPRPVTSWLTPAVCSLSGREFCLVLTDSVVITLQPINHHAGPGRSIVLTPDRAAIPIGRASKTLSKNLIPASDNAWFDSRVMSRDHGVLTVSFDDKVRASWTLCRSDG